VPQFALRRRRLCAVCDTKGTILAANGVDRATNGHRK